MLEKLEEKNLASPVLIRILKNSQNNRARLLAIYALAEGGVMVKDAKVLDFLGEVAALPNFDVAQRGMAILINSHAYDRVIPVLITYLESSDLNKRQVAAVLFNIIGPDAKPVLPALVTAEEKETNSALKLVLARTIENINNKK
jgi:hypothetical protein